MPTIDVTINIFVLGFIVLGAALAGFLVRTRQVARSRAKIDELQREILSNYEQILELEKENTGMESKLQDIEIPVIPIKTSVKEEKKEFQKAPDISLRKKLLSKENLKKQIGNL